MRKVDIVVPVYNEGEKLEKNLQAIHKSISGMQGTRFSLIIVDDGSTDDIQEHLAGIDTQCQDIDVELIVLTRNFGKEAAILAGMEHSRGDAVIVMDSDLQHPPELICRMVSLWREDIEVVEACKSTRGRESTVKRMMAGCFYRVFGMLAGMDITGHSDFKLMDRRVVEAYLSLPERKRFFRGLIPWMGFSSARLYFAVPERSHGKSGWSPFKLLKLSVDALTGFTSAPLHIINILGLICFVISLIIGGIALYYKFAGLAVSGFTTVILLILLIGSFIMFGLGLIGIYLAQIFKEVKRRPVYILDKKSAVSKSTNEP